MPIKSGIAYLAVPIPFVSFELLVAASGDQKHGVIAHSSSPRRDDGVFAFSLIVIAWLLRLLAAFRERTDQKDRFRFSRKRASRQSVPRIHGTVLVKPSVCVVEHSSKGSHVW